MLPITTTVYEGIDESSEAGFDAPSMSSFSGAAPNRDCPSTNCRHPIDTEFTWRTGNSRREPSTADWLRFGVSPTKLQTLACSALSWRLKGKRDRAVFAVLLGCGPRRRELADRIPAFAATGRTLGCGRPGRQGRPYLHGACTRLVEGYRGSLDYGCRFVQSAECFDVSIGRVSTRATA
jgi:hypothetical protein